MEIKQKGAEKMRNLICLILIVCMFPIISLAEPFSFDGAAFGTQYSDMIRSIRQRYSVNDSDISMLSYVTFMGGGFNEAVESQLNDLDFVAFRYSIDKEIPLSIQVSVRSEKQKNPIEVAGYSVSDVYYYFTAVYLDNNEQIQLVSSTDEFVFDKGNYKFDFPKTSRGQTQAEKAYNDIKSKITKLYGDPAAVFPYKFTSSVGPLNGLAEYSVWLGDNDTYIMLHIQPQRDSELKNGKQTYKGDTYARVDLYYGTKWMQTKNEELQKYLDLLKEAYEEQKSYQGL